MKRVLYHLGCLLFTLLQTFLWVLVIGSMIRYNFNFENVYGLFIGLGVIIILSAIGDMFIRKITDKVVVSGLINFLISPIRFIFEAITFVKVIINQRNGCPDPDFGKRGDYEYTLASTLYYVLWNSKKLIETDRQRTMREDYARRNREASAKAEKAKRDRIDFVKSICNSGDNFNFHIIPILCFDDDSFCTFDVHNHRQRCYIKKLYINDVLIVEEDIQRAINMSLKPGKYKFKVLLSLNLRKPGTPEFKLEKTFEVKSSYFDGRTEAFLVLACEVQRKVKEYYADYQKVDEKFISWEHKIDFGYVTKQAIDNACSYWILSKYSINPEEIEYLIR